MWVGVGGWVGGCVYVGVGGVGWVGGSKCVCICVCVCLPGMAIATPTLAPATACLLQFMLAQQGPALHSLALPPCSPPFPPSWLFTIPHSLIHSFVPLASPYTPPLSHITHQHSLVFSLVHPRSLDALAHPAQLAHLQWKQWGVTFSQVVWLIGC